MRVFGGSSTITMRPSDLRMGHTPSTNIWAGYEHGKLCFVGTGEGVEVNVCVCGRSRERWVGACSGGKRPLLGIHEERELEALVLTIEFSATICVHLRCRFQQSHIVMESLSHSSTPYSLRTSPPLPPYTSLLRRPLVSESLGSRS